MRNLTSVTLHLTLAPYSSILGRLRFSLNEYSSIFFQSKFLIFHICSVHVITTDKFYILPPCTENWTPHYSKLTYNRHPRANVRCRGIPILTSDQFWCRYWPQRLIQYCIKLDIFSDPIHRCYLLLCTHSTLTEKTWIPYVHGMKLVNMMPESCRLRYYNISIGLGSGIGRYQKL